MSKSVKMLKILFCVSCCSVPPKSRPPRGNIRALQTKQTNDKIEANEKDRLLANQIQANNEKLDKTKNGVTEAQGKITQTTGELVAGTNKLINNDELYLEGDSIDDASTSVASHNILKRQAAFDSTVSSSSLGGGTKAAIAEQRAQLKLYSDQSLSPPSSIEIEPFTESGALSGFAETTNQEQLYRQIADGSQEEHEQQDDEVAASTMTLVAAKVESPSELVRTFESSVSQNIPSTTKIGDYARIEYSPVDDLESVTTISCSRPGSERGGTRHSRATSSTSLSRRSSLRVSTTTGPNENISRHSSQGIESSISIASQLSNEQFHQNLTNMLETANSPIPMFGTIGLPLGPPLESTIFNETAKTSPETTGAALTSASQDSSLSDEPNGRTSPPSRPATARSSGSTGAALIDDSIERELAYDDVSQSAQAPLAQNETSDEDNQNGPTSSASQQTSVSLRVGSPHSVATTTSGALTNPTPTPTPSELSTGSTKKKRLKAKEFLKRLKPGSKKKNKAELEPENK